MRFLLLAAVMALSGTVRASTSFSADVTDLWWNPEESGWGVNLIQQSNVVFATFFVYDTNGEPHWYVASDLQAANVPTDIRYRFTGRLFETTGPAFSAASFNAGAVARRDVGPMTFEFFPPDNGRVIYSVDGVAVDKVVTRQTWAANDFSGKYSGGVVTIRSPFNAAGCAPPVGLQLFSDITITHSGTSVSMTAVRGDSPPEELCRYTGSYSQTGHMGRIEGAYSCNGGANGSFVLREAEVGVNGVSAAYTATDRGCGVYGNFSAIRTN